MTGGTDSADVGRWRVLAVDDDPILRELIGETLRAQGLDVILTGDGEEALGVLQREALDLAVVDLNMPKLDGFGLLQYIRNTASTKRLPVIVATSSGDKTSIEKAYQLGASSFVTKPVNWTQFAHHVQFVIRSGQVERDLRTAQAEAAAAARMKNGLFNVLSHELKTPLTAMIGMTEVLERSLGARLQASEAQHLSHVSEAAQRLNQIVGDILVLSKAMAGGSKLERALHSPDDLLDEAVLGFRTRANLLGVGLQVLHAPHLPDVYCDQGLVRQALRRLVDNAIKFSQPGGTVKLWAAERSDGSTDLLVSDQGPGISVARLRDCLEPFVQGDMSYSRPVEGLGLGLPIAHTIAEAHGGELVLTTTPGEGLIALLRLPSTEKAASAA